jgi:SWI/SNF-related matrix-associated actin-dependent regulator of chromatin subfamily A member 5
MSTSQAVRESLDAIAQKMDTLMRAASDGDSLPSDSKGGRAAGKRKHARATISEKAEDELMLKCAEEDTRGKTRAPRLLTQPRLLQSGSLRDYQLEGVNWLIHLYHSGINGILADEMGLGKTIQTIAMIAHLAEQRDDGTKYLVLSPKSVVSNWLREFASWLPSLRVQTLGGTKAERRAQIADIKKGGFDVIVTSYEVLSIEKSTLKKVDFRYFVIDEAHRIKNENSVLSRDVRELKAHSKLLLTGTPLQNDLHELWALLHFLVPEHFEDGEIFGRLLQSNTLSTSLVTGRLQRIVRPFLLRRLKVDVEIGLPPKTQVNVMIPLTATQRQLYSDLLKRDVDAITGKDGNRSRLLNIVMQLRKACNHPYLFDGQEPGPPFVEGEHLVESSAKLKLLDALLAKAKAEDARVLVFSQMTRMLDILEDFCRLRGLAYSRIDGKMTLEEREAEIDAFVRPASDRLLFLLSTRVRSCMHVCVCVCVCVWTGLCVHVFVGDRERGRECVCLSPVTLCVCVCVCVCLSLVLLARTPRRAV